MSVAPGVLSGEPQHEAHLTPPGKESVSCFSWVCTSYSLLPSLCAWRWLLCGNWPEWTGSYRKLPVVLPLEENVQGSLWLVQWLRQLWGAVWASLCFPVLLICLSITDFLFLYSSSALCTITVTQECPPTLANLTHASRGLSRPTSSIRPPHNNPCPLHHAPWHWCLYHPLSQSLPGLNSVAEFLNWSISSQRAGTRCCMSLLCKNTILSQVEVSIKYPLDSIEFLPSLYLLNILFSLFHSSQALPFLSLAYFFLPLLGPPRRKV